MRLSNSIIWYRFQARLLWDGLTKEQGNFSHTRTWSSAAYGVALWILIHQELVSKLNTEFGISVLLIVAGHHTLLRLKSAAPKEPKNDPDKT